jgi:hypothetical protein
VPIPTADKTSAKKRIMKELDPWLKEHGFSKKVGFEYHLVDTDGAMLVMLLNVPTFDTFYRVFSRWETSDGRTRVEGPETFPFSCPNHPGPKRYTFRFHLKEETQARCIRNLKEWITEVLLPWFEQRPLVSWSNPNVNKS